VQRVESTNISTLGEWAHTPRSEAGTCARGMRSLGVGVGGGGQTRTISVSLLGRILILKFVHDSGMPSFQLSARGPFVGLEGRVVARHA
jgi:hypothetical protein